MNKYKDIEQIVSLLKTTSAAHCELVLEFVKHLTSKD